MKVFTTKAPRFMFIKIFCWPTLVNIRKRKENKSRFTFNERAFLVFNCSKAKQVRTFPLKSKFPASQGRFLLSMNTTKSLIQNRHWKLGHRSANLLELSWRVTEKRRREETLLIGSIPSLLTNQKTISFNKLFWFSMYLNEE